MLKAIGKFFRSLVPSKAAQTQIALLKQDTEQKEKQCQTDALNGDTQAVRCLNQLDETISAQTMKAMRLQPPKP